MMGWMVKVNKSFISILVAVSFFGLHVFIPSVSSAGVQWCVVNNNGQIIVCVPTKSSCERRAKSFYGATCIAK
jgi:hypothetical protein